MSEPKLSGRLRGVSLGPGAPDLITVRGIRALKKSDRIYYPAPARAKSRCLPVLAHYGFEGKSVPFEADMKSRRAAEKSYSRARALILGDLKRGLDVAVVCEGCLSLYSTVCRLFSGGGLGEIFELIPGVASPFAAAAEAGVCLASGDEKIAVITGSVLPEDAERIFDRFETVAVMKPFAESPAVEIAKRRGLEILLCRDIGGEGSLITDSLPAETESLPYFSLLLIAKRFRRCRGV